MSRSLQDLQAIEIIRFIGHVISQPATPQEGSEEQNLQLSGAETPIGSGSNFPHRLFAEYILSTLQNDQRRHALFSADTPQGTVAGHLKQHPDWAKDFVSLSQQMAMDLYRVMAASPYKGRIKAGDIMLALFREAGTGSDGPTFLAILKIDPSLVSIRRLKEEGGLVRMIFVEEAEIPRPSRDQVHKIALVAPERQGEPEPHDLIVLDNDLPKRDVAQFFYRDFLGASLVRSAPDGIRLLIDGLHEFVSRDDLELDPAERQDLFDHGSTALQTGAPVVLKQFAAAAVAPLPPAKQGVVRAQLLASYREGRPDDQQIQEDETVLPAPRQAQQWTRTLTYKLDQGVTITGSAAAVRSMVKLSKQLDAQGRTTITIKTRKLSWR